MTLAFISLGSNIAPEPHLRAAVSAVVALGRLWALSRVYETAPVGAAGQPRYLNGAALLDTALAPGALKEALRAIEARLGRVRVRDRYAARTIDLDIILYGDRRLLLQGRRIPDPELLRVAHIALPLADLSPGHRHPETGQRLADLAAAWASADVTIRYDLDLWPQRQ
ncbi:MAG: 2-amino-4-hydroxy-6-hydroxymethyldihydropteridine diphosphokinase [Anaerolineae bacterium]|jgi:2-amino-4-hydroxy-6-hydroxymethyldihydropteridine diphosphokinase